MKKIFLLTTILSTFGLFASAQEKVNTIPAPAQQTAPTSNSDIKFEKTTHDYGTIKNGANGVYEFKFTNSGTEPLIISNAAGSCGCTVPEWPKEPILPGASNKIKVSYDTKRTGPFTKTVTISSNAKTPSTVLTIKGTVEAPVVDETVPVKKSEMGATPVATPAVKSK